MTNKTLYRISDWEQEYSSLVNASQNKNESMNRWYPILEGFSNGLIHTILHEQTKIPDLCLDPFAGGGTTPIALGDKGIPCISFEVSPFMSQVCRAKLHRGYNPADFLEIVTNIEKLLYGGIRNQFDMGLKTISKRQGLDKWLFHKASLNALLNVRAAIDESSPESYKDLFYVVLGSMLLRFSNVARDGKALKYKKGWERRYYKHKSIYNVFLEKCRTQVYDDLISMTRNRQDHPINNSKLFRSGDSRKLMYNVEDETVDLMITSPPYLNSRDYTDSHMVELWMLGHVKTYEDVIELRRSTLRSHVQVKWGEYVLPRSQALSHSFKEIMVHKERFWNNNIPSMIAGYFNDLNEILNVVYKKLRFGGRVYMNVANSAYYGQIIQTDIIIAELADHIGFDVVDIRLARRIKTSSQQARDIKWLRESIVVLQKS